MKYLNTILTLIAVLLIIIILQLNKIPMAKAGNNVTDINLKQIAGYNLYNKILEVKE